MSGCIQPWRSRAPILSGALLWAVTLAPAQLAETGDLDRGSAIVSFAPGDPATSDQPIRSPRRPLGRPLPDPLPDSTPEEQGLDPTLLSLAYDRAAEIPQIYSMLVVKNGYLVAEEYFGLPDATTARPIASVTKSIVSVLVGIALQEGYLSGLDQRMLDFFPEYDQPNLDPRKGEITIRHLLQMRAGYPFDSTTEFFDQLTQSNNWLRFIIVDYPLTTDPGTTWNYSNASAHVLAGILTRATGMSLRAFTNAYVFGPMGLYINYWPSDPQGYNVGPGDVHCTPRELAAFGRLILNRGYWYGRAIIPQEWIEESFQDYSSTFYGTMWPYRDIRYGYMWWHADVDDHEVFFAWGHGGQFITVVPSLAMVVVTTAYNFIGDFTENSWDTEGAIFYMIANDVLPAAY